MLANASDYNINHSKVRLETYDFVKMEYVNLQGF